MVTTSTAIMTTNITSRIFNDSLEEDDYDSLILLEDGHTFNDRFILSIAMTPVNIFVVICLVAQTRVKRIPKLSKFIASGLLFFDSLSLVFLNVRSFMPERFSTMFYVFGMTTGFVSYLTVACMSVERYSAIARPYFYIRYSHHGTKLVILYWATVFLVYAGLPFGHCKLTSPTINHACILRAITLYTLIFFFLICVTSIPCLIGTLRILHNMWKITPINSKAYRIKGNKCTIVVAACLVNMTATGTTYCLVHLLEKNISIKRFVLEILVLVNSTMDAVVYVVWYRECRMQILKMFECIHPAIVNKVERMRAKVFQIVVSDNKIGTTPSSKQTVSSDNRALQFNSISM